MPNDIIAAIINGVFGVIVAWVMTKKNKKSEKNNISSNNNILTFFIILILVAFSGYMIYDKFKPKPAPICKRNHCEEPPEPVLKPSCEEIKAELAKKGIYNVGCNETTTDGYYWEIYTDHRIDDYGGWGSDIAPNSRECPCDENTIGNVGQTIRVRHERGWAHPVAEKYKRNVSANSPGIEQGEIWEGYINDYEDNPSKGEYMGVYIATCKKYKH